MTKAALPLSQLSRTELEFLRKAIVKRQLATPLSEAGLASLGKAALFAKLGPLAGTGEAAALALIELALASGEPVAAAAAPRSSVLVLTDPKVALPNVRATTAVLLELLGAATERVLIAGYEFGHGAVLFGPLHKAMAERNVKVTICLKVPPAPSPKSMMSAYLAVQAHQFLKQNWPFGAPLPQLYYFPAGCEHGSHRSLHAKCVIVDDRHVLVGSANFTQRGHTRNLEVGVRLDDPSLAHALTMQFKQLIDNGELRALPIVAVQAAAPPAEAENEDEPAAVTAMPVGAAFIDELGVDDALRPLLTRLLARGLPAPDVGADIEGTAGQVIGSPELSWDEGRVAVLLPEQEGSRNMLESAGWACYGGTLSPAEFEALCARVRGGG